MITPVIGKKYIIHHTSGNRVMTFQGEEVVETRRIYSRVFPDCPPIIRRGYTHYIFSNDVTRREVEIKSRLKIRKEVVQPNEN